jgi:ABC-type Fe3+/spermidine/putrescine transport system ATPase subunit
MRIIGGRVEQSKTTAGDFRPFLDIRALVKRYGATVALAGCTLDVREGEILTLLGPSGCGKTTLLRAVAGFVEPDEGVVLIDGVDALTLPVNRRPVGVVFQNYALFPHLSVARNVGYGLKMRGLARDAVAAKVHAALESVSLTGFGARYPGQLSGGQQQRVAIARVLVLEPKVLLLDEPFNALDAKLRVGMQVELRKLIKRLNMTAVFVTHDQDEAQAISDRIAVMRAGAIEQVGAPAAIYDRPANAYVADFIGVSNMLPARAEGGRALLPDGAAVATPLAGAVTVMVRPQNLALTPGAAAGWGGRIAFAKQAGATIEYEVESPVSPLLKVVAMRAGQDLAVGSAVAIAVRDPQACVVFAP